MAEDVDPVIQESCQNGGESSVTQQISSPRTPSISRQNSCPSSPVEHTAELLSTQDINVTTEPSSSSSSQAVSLEEQPKSLYGLTSDSVSHTCASVCNTQLVPDDSVQPDSQAAESHLDAAFHSKADGTVENGQSSTDSEQIEIDVDDDDDEVSVTKVQNNEVIPESRSETSLTRAVTGILRQDGNRSRERHRSEIGAAGSHLNSNGPAEAGGRKKPDVIENVLHGVDDASSLPRPSNPGGLYDSRLSGLEQHGRREPDFFGVDRSHFTLQLSDHSVDTQRTHNLRSSPHERPRSGATNRSFRVADTPVKWSSSINESVERPLPSSIVDSERVRKNMARLNNTVEDMDSHWSLRLHDNQASSSINLDSSPPERPRPPLRTVDPLPEPNALNRAHMQSPNPPGRHDRSIFHNLDQHPGLSALSSLRRHSDTSTSHHSHIAAVFDGDKSSPEPLDLDDSFYSMSPDEDLLHFPASRFYKCRFCNFSAATYTQLQLHMPKHGGHLKALKCPLCDYTTNDKSNFRRHRRLHARNNPVSVLKCGKCSYATILARKIREHYQQVHNDTGLPGMTSEWTDAANFSPQRFMGPRTFGQLDHHHTSCPSATITGSSSGLHSVFHNSNINGGYPYTTTSNTQSLPGYLQGHYNSYSNNSTRGRETTDNHMASNYLRSIVSSIMNSHHSSRPQASSTITSSSLLAPSVSELTPQVSSLDTSNMHHGPEVKVKVEPIDCDGVSDVSSSVMSNALSTPDITQQISTQSSQRLSATLEDRRSSLNQEKSTNNVSGTCSAQSWCRSQLSFNAIASSEHQGHPDPGFLSVTDNVLANTSIKSETVSVGIQCILPVIKSEVDLDGDYYTLDQYGGGHYSRCRCTDKGVQCDITTPSVRSHRLSNRTQSASESEMSEHHSSVGGESRCGHCGICFEDEVMFSIHIGCHSHTDPFICNVCGKQCGNKYGFYSHIMRGHHF